MRWLNPQSATRTSTTCWKNWPGLKRNSRSLPAPTPPRKKSEEKSSRVSKPSHTGIPRSEEHTSELQSLMRISYAVFCLKKKNIKITTLNNKKNQNIQQHRQLNNKQKHITH